MSQTGARRHAARELAASAAAPALDPGDSRSTASIARMQPPDRTQRDNNPSFVWGEVRNAAGQTKTARVRTANGYSLTVASSLGILSTCWREPGRRASRRPACSSARTSSPHCLDPRRFASTDDRLRCLTHARLRRSRLRAAGLARERSPSVDPAEPASCAGRCSLAARATCWRVPRRRSSTAATACGCWATIRVRRPRGAHRRGTSRSCCTAGKAAPTRCTCCRSAAICSNSAATSFV